MDERLSTAMVVEILEEFRHVFPSRARLMDGHIRALSAALAQARAALTAVRDAWETDEDGADTMEDAIYEHVIPCLEGE